MAIEKKPGTDQEDPLAQGVAPGSGDTRRSALPGSGDTRRSAVPGSGDTR